MNERGSSRWRSSTLVLAFIFLYTPIVWVILYSFSATTAGFDWRRWSLRWYQALLTDETFRSAAFTSMLLAILSATVATFLGTLAGVALARIPRFRGRSLMLLLLAIPIFAPEILIGFAFLMLFVGLQAVIGWPEGKGLTTLVIAHATLGMSLVASIVFARVAGRDPTLEQAASDLGARPLRIFATVTIPLAMPGIVAGWLLALTISFDDVITSSFLAGPDNATLPMAVYSSIRVGVNPELNAIGTLLVAGVGLMLAVAVATWRKRGPRIDATAA